MNIRDWAMIGVGMTLTLLYQKYASEYVCDMIDSVSKSVDKVTKEISQMM